MEIQLSVVIPTYRRPKLLLNCLSALGAQRFDPEAFEIIVVSDGPDKPTENVVTRWNVKNLPRIRYFHIPEKKGPAAARNYGWLNAKGGLVAFTDDDCIPDENWLQAFYNQYHAEDCLAFSGKTVVPVPEKPTDYELNIANLQTADFITANCCCTKKALAITGGFDEQFTMAWREDSDLEFKLIKAGIFIIKVGNAIVTHPVRKAAWGISIKEQKKTLYNALLYKKYPELYRQKIQPASPVHYYMIILAFFIMMTGFILRNTSFATGGFIIWMSLTLLFTLRRLHATTLAPYHLLEMVVTSLCIPFLSVYWQCYGAIKYRVLFI
ncbi:glycosyltransferase [Mucilaginibacter sp.]|uniref:glycosyltransferase family 2 protein n=1 Tax=Mucilaginibacter sp. TaxID=1882438 RepID=UPI00261497D9|nr:glycosyltransferase [Mucilaginibacter sp.]MDB4926651.1 glycosyl transferase family 2 [Mucilaginibacter sp.]